MCLYVMEVPANLRASNAVRCWKKLDPVPPVYGWFRTPYQGVTVPLDGILLPHGKSPLPANGSATYGSEIYGGAIHASVGRPQCYDHYLAYAFGVIAYGADDLACAMLYVPTADRTKDRAPRARVCREWARTHDETLRGPTDAQVRKVFPMFQPKR